MSETAISQLETTNSSETPQPGERLKFVDAEGLTCDQATQDENSHWVNPNYTERGIKTLNITFTPEVQRRQDEYNRRMNEGLRQTRGGWTEPGGTKTPSYGSDIPSGTSRAKPPELKIYQDTEVEVVGIQEEKDGKKEMIIRYLDGPAVVYPAGHGTEPVNLDEIAQIDGIDRQEYFRQQAFMVPYHEGIAERFRKQPINPPKTSFLKRIFRR